MEESWRPDLVALDIDGTLLDRDGNLPEEVRAAVRRVVAAGVPVVLATGRSWHATEPVARLLHLPSGPHVCSNGAVVVRYPEGEFLRVLTFDPSAVIATMVRVAPEALIAAEELGVGFRVNRVFPEGELAGVQRVVSVEELGSEPATRVVIRDPDADPDEFAQLADHLGMHEASYTIGWSAWIDITPQGVDKSTGLAFVAEQLGVDAAGVLAIGDGGNDREMLTWAGRGVALGDTQPQVRASADAVVARFAEGGTAQELSRWFG